jgi:hypothetical protein
MPPRLYGVAWTISLLSKSCQVRFALTYPLHSVCPFLPFQWPYSSLWTLVYCRAIYRNQEILQ